jgi:hypothetical protein
MSDIQPRQSAEVGLLLDDLKTLIDQARQQVAVAVNAGLTLLYWQVGQRILKDLLLEKERAAYGEEIVATLSRQLMQRYGKGFTKSALNRMVQFAEVFPDPQIVATLSQQSGGRTSCCCCHWINPCSATFTPKCAASSAGVCAP